ncbi:MAG: hypothetical protein KBD00_04855 [Candidatus Peribacteraceae bacterium]|nr:hypothetical protein [Candidatus Peribacteraceae bacterium]
MDQTNNIPAVLEWQAPSQIDHDRSERWYAIAGILAVALIVYGLLTGAWTMSLVIAIAAGLYFLVRNEKHALHSIRILEAGIEYDGKVEVWDAFKNFWILRGITHTQLHVARKGLKPDIVIFTDSIDAHAIYEALNPHLPHDPEKREKMIDAIIRYCKI